MTLPESRRFLQLNRAVRRFPNWVSCPFLQFWPRPCILIVLQWKFDHSLDDLAEIEPAAHLAAMPPLPGEVMSWLRTSVVLGLACTVAYAAGAAERIDLTPADETG